MRSSRDDLLTFLMEPEVANLLQTKGRARTVEKHLGIGCHNQNVDNKNVNLKRMDPKDRMNVNV